VETYGNKLLPFYVVVDVSFSMSGDRIDAANQILPEIADALSLNPILSDKVRIGLLDFSGDAQVQLPLCDVLDQNLALPNLVVRRGGTSYAAAFRLLRAEIAANVKQLKADRFQVHRPAVFFLSDGQPTDKAGVWQAAFAELVSDQMYPNIIPFGVDKADGRTMQALIHPAQGRKQMKMFLMDEGGDPATAISEMAKVMITSVIRSGNSLAQGETGIQLPDKGETPEGVSQYSAEDEDMLP
jgi:uncharacterized protein YegL